MDNPPRRMELLATIVMAAAAILTAWATFQSSMWNGIETVEYSRANAVRIESVSFANRADSLRAIDLAVFLQWLEAVGEEIQSGTAVIDPVSGYQPVDGSRSTFYYERLRAEFLPALDAWIATMPLENEDAPPSPFAMAEYRLADAATAATMLEQAEEHAASALAANRNSSNHTLMAVVLAIAIFFAGIGTKMEAHRNQRGMILLSDAIFVGAFLTLVILPKVPLW